MSLLDNRYFRYRIGLDRHHPGCLCCWCEIDRIAKWLAECFPDETPQECLRLATETWEKARGRSVRY